MKPKGLLPYASDIYETKVPMKTHVQMRAQVLLRTEVPLKTHVLVKMFGYY